MNIKAGLDKKVMCLMILYLVVCAAGIVMNLRQGNVQGAKMGVVALFTPWIVPVIFRLFSLHNSEPIRAVSCHPSGSLRFRTFFT